MAVKRFVVDASMALKWQFRDELEAEGAVQLFSDFIERKVDLVSPTLFAYEVVNAVHIAVSRERTPEGEGIGIITDILGVGLALVDFSGLIERTFNLARLYNRSAYDCAYIALAEKEGCILYTGDRRLYNALKDKLAFVRWAGDYP